jgi:hypothetical protein
MTLKFFDKRQSVDLSMRCMVQSVDLHEAKEQVMQDSVFVDLRHVVLLRSPDDEDRKRNV